MKQNTTPISLWKTLLHLAYKIRFPENGNSDDPEHQVITFSQFRVFQYLFAYDFEAPSIKFLAQFAGVTPSAISQTTDDSVAKGLLRRERDYKNHCVRLVLTETGLQFKAEIQKRYQENYDRFIRICDENEDGIFHEGLVFAVKYLVEHLPDIQFQFFAHKIIPKKVILPKEIDPDFNKMPNWKLILRIHALLIASTFPLLSQTTKLTLTKKRILFFLFITKKKEISMQTIIQHFPMETATLSQTVDTLEKDGIIERRVPNKDKRQTYLSLTSTGQSLRKQIRHYSLHVINLLKKEADAEKVERFLNAFQTRLQNSKYQSKS